MAFSAPANNLIHFGLEPGMTVVDLGAGSGAYTFEIAKLIGSGRVYAVDVQKDLLAKLAAEARARHLANVEIIWGDVEKSGGTKLRDNIAHLVLLSNLLFQVVGKYTMALEIKRILRPGGRLALIDWTDSFAGLGPRADQVVTAPAATTIFHEAGFKEIKSFPAGDHHYGLLFEKPN